MQLFQVGQEQAVSISQDSFQVTATPSQVLPVSVTLTGSPSSAFNVYLNPVSKLTPAGAWAYVFNHTGQNAIIRSLSSSSNTVTVAAGNNAVVYTNGTGVFTSPDDVAYTLPTSSTLTLGGVKIDGSTITIASGVISASPYTLPTASNSTLGGVKVDGTSITISSGVISAGTYTLPTASTSVLGGVKVDGSTINISSGVISASVYTLPTASDSVLGGVKVDGTTVTISSGVISAHISSLTSPTITNQILTAGTAPTIASVTAAAGVGATAAITGSPISFTLTVTAGTGTSSGLLCTISLPTGLGAGQRPMLTAGNAASAPSLPYASLSGDILSVSLGVAPTESVDQVFYVYLIA